MSSIMNTQGVVLATAVAVSGTLIFLSIFWEKNSPHTQLSGNHEDSQSSKPTLRPCISSYCKKREKKKKRVRFAESVKDSSGNITGDGNNKEIINEGGSSCYNYRGDLGLLMTMPANRVALYTGILNSRVYME